MFHRRMNLLQPPNYRLDNLIIQGASFPWESTYKILKESPNL